MGKIIITMSKCSPDFRRAGRRMLLQACRRMLPLAAGSGLFCRGGYLCALRGGLTGRWWMARCLVSPGWLSRWQEHWSLLQRPFVVWRSPQPRPAPLCCRPCADAFVLRGERGAEPFPGLSPSASRARLKACEGTHSPAWCCLNGFGLWDGIGSDGSLSVCKNSVFLTHYLHHHCVLYFCCPSESLSSTRAYAEMVVCLKKRVLCIPSFIFHKTEQY